MTLSRRSWLASASAVGCLPYCLTRTLGRAGQNDPLVVREAAVAEALERPVLRPELFSEPIVLESLDALRHGEEILIRARSRDGAEGIIASNSWWLADTYPLFINRVAHYLTGKDMRFLETHLTDMLREQLNYKLQGLALWVCVAAAEMAVLELLGRVSNRSIARLLGRLQHPKVAIYRASGRRGNRPGEEIDHLRELVAQTGATAVKFRLGGMLSDNEDSLPGRSEALIPMVREAFGDAMTLYADANSSYDADNGIRIGRLMQEHDYAFFEEPCRFDDLWATQRVAAALEILVAGGEQEFSERRFRWSIVHGALDVVQPDLHYYGGFIRATRVARMAAALGLECTPHMSGWGMGYVQALHFMSYLPNAASHLEYKGLSQVPFHCATSSLKPEGGFLTVPTGPGFGLEIDPDYVRQSRLLTTA